jgi:amino acid transporter
MQENNGQSAQSEGQHHLVRGISLIGVSFLVLNGMIGAGIFALPSVIAAQAGLLSPWLFLGVGFLFITVVLTFAELTSYFRESGGPVLYTTAAYGPLMGFNTGWILFLGRLTAFAANTNVMVLYMMSLTPWVGDGTVRAGLIILICGSLTLVNVIGVKDGMRTVFGFSILKLTPLVLMIILGLQYTSIENFSFADLPTVDDLGGTTLLLIYAFIGFEQATVSAGETKNPRRNVPRALVYTIIGTGILYFFITLVYVSVLPEGGQNGQTLVDVGRVLAGPAGALIITLTAIFSIGGNLASSMLTVPRLTYSLAEKKLLPKWFGRIHDKYDTPHNSVKFLGVLATILALTGSFVYLAMASSLARLVTYILCIAALPIIRKNATPEQAEHVYRLKGGYLIPAIAMALCLWIGIQSKLESWAFIGGLMLVGLGLYWLETRSNKNKGK